MSREQAALSIAKDVAQVRRHARTVIDIGIPRSPLVRDNGNPLLDITAVVGPGAVNGYRFQESLLCEIGLRRTRPYSRSERRARATKSGMRPYVSLVPPRHSWCVMSREGYLRVAPVLFETLSAWMRDVTGRWGSLGFSVKTPRLYANRKNQLQFAEHYGTYPRGCRISVSRRDSFLVADLLAAERDDPFWEKQLSGLATLIMFAFKPLEEGWEGSFLRQKTVEYVREVLVHRLRRSLPTYMMWELPQYLSGEKGTRELRRYTARKYRLLPEVRELLAEVTGISQKEVPWQQRLADEALPGRAERMKDFLVRDISSLRSREDSKKHWVFELLPYQRVLIVRPQVKKS